MNKTWSLNLTSEWEKNYEIYK